MSWSLPATSLAPARQQEEELVIALPAATGAVRTQSFALTPFLAPLLS